MRRIDRLGDTRLQRVVAGILLLLVTASANAVDTPNPGDWRFGAQIYFFGASIGGQTATGGDIDISIDEILDNLDMALMGTVGARKGKWTLRADVIYLDVEGKSNSTLTIPNGSGLDISRHNSVKLKGWIVTPAVSYNLIENEKGILNVLGGARYLWLESDLTMRIDAPLRSREVTVSDSGGIWDAIVGASGQINLAEKWYLPYYVDVGTGNSNLTWQAFAGVGYRFEKFDGIIGYRYLDWDFDDNDNDVFDDLNMSGVVVGAKFSF